MATNGFTKIDNSIIFNLDLTPTAFMLYTKIKYFASIQGFKINREHMKSVSGYGETAFRRAWKELKEKGLLIQTKERVQGKFEYTYALEGAKTSKPKKENKPVDSDGHVPLDGQIHIDDVIASKEDVAPVESEDVKVVAETTGFDAEQSKELLKAAKSDVYKIMESYKYVMQQRTVKNVFGYTKWAIKNNKILSVACGSESNKGYFNNYPQRNYDANKLERLLLYGEEYELPI